jgi:hypothetical protein
MGDALTPHGSATPTAPNKSVPAGTLLLSVTRTYVSAGTHGRTTQLSCLSKLATVTEVGHCHRNRGHSNSRSAVGSALRVCPPALTLAVRKRPCGDAFASSNAQLFKVTGTSEFCGRYEHMFPSIGYDLAQGSRRVGGA